VAACIGSQNQTCAAKRKFKKVWQKKKYFQRRYQPAFCRTSNPESKAMSSSLRSVAQLCRA
jgi:hypothetical protein